MTLQEGELTGHYGFGDLFQRGLRGRDTKVAIVVAKLRASLQDDFDCFNLKMDLPPARLQIFRASTPNSVEDSAEAAADVEIIHELAAEAAVLIVVARDNSLSGLEDAIRYAVKEKGADVVSMSLAAKDCPQGNFCRPSNRFELFSAESNVAFIGSSGDQGGVTQWPALEESVLSVGGTGWVRDQQGEIQEKAWWGSGGGKFWIAWPWWPLRDVPDVAFAAEWWPIYDNGSWSPVSGTSQSAPAWAALAALVRQRSGSLQAGKCRFVDAVRAIGRSDLAAQFFLDVTENLPCAASSPCANQAGPGYDYATGYGTPHASALVEGIAQVFRSTKGSDAACVLSGLADFATPGRPPAVLPSAAPPSSQGQTFPSPSPTAIVPTLPPSTPTRAPIQPTLPAGIPALAVAEVRVVNEPSIVNAVGQTGNPWTSVLVLMNPPGRRTEAVVDLSATFGPQGGVHVSAACWTNPPGTRPCESAFMYQPNLVADGTAVSGSVTIRASPLPTLPSQLAASDLQALSIAFPIIVRNGPYDLTLDSVRAADGARYRVVLQFVLQCLPTGAQCAVSGLAYSQDRLP